MKHEDEFLRDRQMPRQGHTSYYSKDEDRDEDQIVVIQYTEDKDEGGFILTSRFFLGASSLPPGLLIPERLRIIRRVFFVCAPNPIAKYSGRRSCYTPGSTASLDKT